MSNKEREERIDKYNKISEHAFREMELDVDDVIYSTKRDMKDSTDDSLIMFLDLVIQELRQRGLTECKVTDIIFK